MGNENEVEKQGTEELVELKTEHKSAREERAERKARAARARAAQAARGEAPSIAKRVKRRVKKPIRFMAKDWSFFHAFPHEYDKAVAQTEVDPKKVILLDVKSQSMPDAFSLLAPYLREKGYNVQFVGLGQNEYIGWIEYYKRCLELMRNLASAKFVYVCDACDVVSCLDLRPETIVVQLWHACGAFKKWGMSTADRVFGGTSKSIQRHPFYENLSLVTVSSPEVKWAYREAMILEDEPETVQALGVSRTDVFFDEEYLANARAEVEAAVPAVAGKKLLFYAPTFRGHAGNAEAPNEFDLPAMRDALADEWVLVIKHHPFVKELPEIPEDCRDFAFMVTDVSTEKLLCVADVCISDYSSLVFEYSLFGRPMAFFAYDLDEYDDWRGFYYNYDEMTPGPVLKTTDELIDYIEHIDERFDAAEVAAFREKFMSACDGHATERIVEWTERFSAEMEELLGE